MIINKGLDTDYNSVRTRKSGNTCHFCWMYAIYINFARVYSSSEYS